MTAMRMKRILCLLRQGTRPDAKTGFAASFWGTASGLADFDTPDKL
jgi:hypothetical protein